MAYKRRRLTSGASSRSRSSSKPNSSSKLQSSRLNSVSRSIARSSPALPPLSQKRISLRAPGSSIAGSSSHGGNNVRHEVIETDAEIQAREDADEMNEVILAVDMRDRTIGCAYYIAREEKLCLMEDIKMAGLDIIDMLKIHAQPTLILISTRSDERLEEHLAKDARGIDRGDDASKCLFLLRCDDC
jgi:DNA mismatch repair protein MSH5